MGLHIGYKCKCQQNLVIAIDFMDSVPIHKYGQGHFPIIEG